MDIREICPFDIPRYDEKLGVMAKCTMCIDRVSEGMLPACVKACPTGTMQFGDRKTIRKMAEDRLYEVRKIYRRASLVNPEAVKVIFLLKDYPEKYHRFAANEQRQNGNRNGRMALKKILLAILPIVWTTDDITMKKGLEIKGEGSTTQEEKNRLSGDPGFLLKDQGGTG